jgi:hypothetical protein
MISTTVLTFRNPVITRSDIEKIEDVFFRRSKLIVVCDIGESETGSIMTIDAYKHLMWLLKTVVTSSGDKIVSLSYRVNERITKKSVTEDITHSNINLVPWLGDITAKKSGYIQMPKFLQDEYSDLKNVFDISGVIVIQDAERKYIVQ